MFELYDFESKDYKTSKSGMDANEIEICRSDIEVSTQEKLFNQPANIDALCTVKKDQYGYFID